MQTSDVDFMGIAKVPSITISLSSENDFCTHLTLNSKAIERSSSGDNIFILLECCFSIENFISFLYSR